MRYHVQVEHALYYLVGMGLAGMICFALGQAFVREQGLEREATRIYRIAALATAVLGLLLGWSLNAFIDYVRESATIHF